MAVGRANRIGRSVVKAVDGVVNIAILTIVMLLVAVAVYAIWDSNQVFHEANAEQYETYKPSTEDSVSLEELRAINPEVFAWITLYGTRIDYPVTQGPNNTKYVSTNAFGEYSLAGAIFLDRENDQSFQDFNSILYGHYMEKQTMFGELGSFIDKDYFDSHRFGNLFYDGKDHGLEFFAFLQTDAYDGKTFAPGVQGEESQQAYLKRLLKMATHTRDIGVTTSDRILLMSTCSSETTNGRSILIGRITDERYIDALVTEIPAEAWETETVDKQLPFWDTIPPWFWVALPVLLLMLLLVLLLLLLAIGILHKRNLRNAKTGRRRRSKQRREMTQSTMNHGEAYTLPQVREE